MLRWRSRRHRAPRGCSRRILPPPNESHTSPSRWHSSEPQKCGSSATQRMRYNGTCLSSTRQNSDMGKRGQGSEVKGHGSGARGLEDFSISNLKSEIPSPCFPARSIFAWRPRRRPSSAALSPPASNACKPAIVVPPGLATRSFSTAGCSPVISTISAAPRTVWAAICVAIGARQAHLHAGVAEGLDHHVHERRPGTGQTGHRVQQFFFHLPGRAQGAEQPSHQRAVLGRGMLAQAIGAGALPHEAGRVRHHADQPQLRPQPFGQRGQPNARGNRNDQPSRPAGKLPRKPAATWGICCGLTARMSTSD